MPKGYIISIKGEVNKFNKVGYRSAFSQNEIKFLLRYFIYFRQLFQSLCSREWTIRPKYIEYLKTHLNSFVEPPSGTLI